MSVDQIEDHQMHAEFYHLSPESAASINRIKQSGGSITAVGTTSVRTRETIARDNKQIVPSSADGYFYYAGI